MSEFICPDGYPHVYVPLKAIGFLDLEALRSRVFTGADQERYAAYTEVLAQGHAVNGSPVVYRTPKGNLIASDIKHSDIVVLARLNVQFPAAIDQHVLDPKIGVKIIDVASRDDIPVQRAAYLEANR